MPASVHSFDAIVRVREELQKFAHRSGEGLSELDGEIRRLIDWVEHDRPAFWKEQLRKAFDAEAEAKNNLNRCLMYPINDEQPSCAEERAELKKATARLQYCEEKRKRVREWSQKLRHELHEYHGRVSQLKQATEIDTKTSSALLLRAVEALEKYAAGSPTGKAPAAPSESEPAQKEPSE